MKSKGYKKLVDYWQKTAEHDYETMKSLFAGKRYDASLFFGHIVLEKIFKAAVANATKDHAPYTHNLIKLAEVSKIELDEKELNLLKEVNDFNIEARYPEQKLQFYNLCNKKYAEKYIKEIDKLYKKLCQKLKPKK
jgi:HEPN domain-containing protein